MAMSKAYSVWRGSAPGLCRRPACFPMVIQLLHHIKCYW